MSENTEKQDAGIENFLNKHLVKLLWGVALYFLVQLSSDFKDVKATLQAILTNQATIELRLGNLENASKQQQEIDARQDAKIDRNYDLAQGNQRRINSK